MGIVSARRAGATVSVAGLLWLIVLCFTGSEQCVQSKFDVPNDQEASGENPIKKFYTVIFVEGPEPLLGELNSTSKRLGKTPMIKDSATVAIESLLEPVENSMVTEVWSGGVGKLFRSFFKMKGVLRGFISRNNELVLMAFRAFFVTWKHIARMTIMVSSFVWL